MNLQETIRRILKEETTDTEYAVIEILKPSSRMPLKWYFQAVPLNKTEQDKIYIKRGPAGTLTISTKNIKIHKTFKKSEKEEMDKYLEKLRDQDKKKEEQNESDPKVGTGKKPKGSDRRLYTDENPKDTVSVKFRTKQDIVDTLSKESFKSKSHARQSQIINLIHQRLRVALQRAKDPDVKKRLRTAFEYIEMRKEASKRKTQEMKESEITERCWKGYTQKGMKTMFGKRYPNCVKKKK
jgi:hypothetical protein